MANGYDFESFYLNYPEDHGTCSKLFDPMSGKGVINLQTSTLIDDETNDLIVKSLNWINNYFPVKSITIDGLEYPLKINIDGKNNFYFAEGYPFTSPFFDNQSPWKYKFAIEKFLNSGMYDGIVHGFDHNYHYKKQVQAVKELINYYDLVQNQLGDLLDFFFKYSHTYFPQIIQDYLYHFLYSGKVDSKTTLELFNWIMQHDLDHSSLRVTSYYLQNMFKIQGAIQSKTSNIGKSQALELFKNMENRIPRETFDKLNYLLTQWDKENKKIKDKNTESGISLNNKEYRLFSYLKDLAVKYEVSLDEYSEFRKMLDDQDAMQKFLLLAVTFNDKDIWKLLDILVEKTNSSVGHSFVKGLRLVHYLKKMTSFKILPAEYQEMFATGISVQQLYSLFKKLNVQLYFSTSSLNRAFSYASNYYYRATRRAIFMSRYINYWFDTNEGKDQGVLLVVNSGYLSKIVENELRNSNLAFYSVTPEMPSEMDFTRKAEQYYRYVSEIQ